MQQKLAVASVLILALLAGASFVMIGAHAMTQASTGSAEQTQSTVVTTTSTSTSPSSSTSSTNSSSSASSSSTSSTNGTGTSLLTNPASTMTGEHDDFNETETEGGNYNSSTYTTMTSTFDD